MGSQDNKVGAPYYKSVVSWATSVASSRSSSPRRSIFREIINTKQDATPADSKDVQQDEQFTEPPRRPGDLQRSVTALSGAISRSQMTGPEIVRRATVLGIDANDSRLDPNSADFDFPLWAKHLISVLEREGIKRPRIDTTFRDLQITANGSELKLHKSVGSVLMTPFGFSSISRHRQTQQKKILHNFNGTMKSGELLLVLGRPGSGCTTFLKAITGHLSEVRMSETSSIQYSGVPQDAYTKGLRGEILYNQENEAHFPHLSVSQTLRFAIAARAPLHNFRNVKRDEFCEYLADVVMKLFGLSHARDTRVGNDFVRGVSGGERKRVSIAEMALTGGQVGAWDNSTRGLDSATALEFVRCLKIHASTMGTAHAVAIYQASQAIYDLFDKVIVLHEGRQIYYGPASKACAYFEEMGYQKPARMTSGDFLTSVTNPNERIPRPGSEQTIPRTPDDFQKYWQQSQDYRSCMAELNDTEGSYLQSPNTLEQFTNFHEMVQSKHTRKQSPYRISVPMQIRICMRRHYQRMWNEKSQTIAKVVAPIVQALIVGSIFINTPSTTDAFFAKGSVLFCTVLVNTLMSVAEIPGLFAQRPIVEKHAEYALYHPASEAFAGILADLPIKLLISTCFGIILYFLAGLKSEAGAFFIFYLFTTITMLTMSAVFRTIAAAAKAVTQAMAFAGITILSIVIYTGFTLQRTYMQDWLRWISYVNPIAYVFEALLANEVHGVEYPCATQSYVPAYGHGLGASCAVPGAKIGQKSVLGDDWIASAYGYNHTHVWRNFGIVLAFLMFFYAAYVYLSEINYKTPTKGEYLVFRRGHEPKSVKSGASDEENGSISAIKSVQVDEAVHETEKIDMSKQEVFTWRDVSLDVPVKGGTRRLLDQVSGWVKPGTLTALMGTSGAGKTTLLDTLAQRISVGVITGEMFVSGRPLDGSFHGKTGYVQQQDVHLETTTVREALQFSAMLRQPPTVSKEAKYGYVEEVIQMLGMEDFAEAIVGLPGEGLNIEQRKLLSIGVELAARPSLLVFLDEPTSGLDSQSSWSIICLLRRLADSGQAVLATIHQPSAMLFQQFDRLLFLAKGGHTVYFGDLGQSSRTLLDYFESAGARQCGDAENPAEYMLEIIGSSSKDGKAVDWPSVWKSSEEAKAVQTEIQRIHREQNSSGPSDGQTPRQYAMPFRQQIYHVNKRVFQQYWRTPQYVFGKLILCTACALFVGFSFFHPNSSITGLQNSLFAIFMVLTIFTALVQQIMPRFISSRALYETRERHSHSHSWLTFMFSSMVVEVPYQMVAAFLVWVAWYFSVFGTGHTSSTNVTMLAFCLVFYAYTSSFAFFIIAALPDAQTAGPIAALIFSLTLTFSGVLQRPSALPQFWHFMWRVSPFTYMLGGWAATGLKDRQVNCATNELAVFDPPSNATCGMYLEKYFEAGAIGRLLNPSATSQCQYCPLQNANQFLATSEIYQGDVYRNLGISWGYVVFNVLAAIGLYYMFRVRKVSLFGQVKGLVGKMRKGSDKS